MVSFDGVGVVVLKRKKGELDRPVEHVLAIVQEKLIMIVLVRGIMRIILSQECNHRKIPLSLSVVSKVWSLCGGLLNR